MNAEFKDFVLKVFKTIGYPFLFDIEEAFYSGFPEDILHGFLAEKLETILFEHQQRLLKAETTQDISDSCRIALNQLDELVKFIRSTCSKKMADMTELISTLIKNAYIVPFKA